MIRVLLECKQYSTLCSEGDEVTGLPEDISSARGHQASSPLAKAASGGQRRRRTIYIAGMKYHVIGHVIMMMMSLILSGRPPWYDSQGQIAEAFVIGEIILT